MTTKSYTQIKTTIFSKKSLEKKLGMFGRISPEAANEQPLLKAYRRVDDPNLLFFGNFQTENSDKIAGVETTNSCKTHQKPVASLLFKDCKTFGHNADEIMVWTDLHKKVEDFEQEMKIKIEPLKL